MDVDYIIVGQGLAGSAVAVQLLKQKKSIVVYDNPAANNSSRIAAGLFNPVTGKKMVRTWLADRLFPLIHQYYAEVEKMSGNSFFFPVPVYRPFLSIEEQNEWMARSADPVYAPFIQEILTTPSHPGVNDPFGGLLLKQSGWLDTMAYISSVGTLIRQSGTLVQEPFHSENVVPEKDFIRYGDIRAGKVIFCSGAHPEKWFEWVPIRPLKGETLTISTSLDSSKVINRGIYMIPQKQAGDWRVGSTYNFHDSGPEPTQAGRTELEEKIETLISVPFAVREHVAGFRPTTPDRRPVLGYHPADSRILIFNGLGTKGVSLAPYFSEVLVRALENGGQLNKEVDIERFKLLYSSSARLI
jgi:glycine oxidase